MPANPPTTSSPANLPTPGNISPSWLYAGCFTDPLPASNASEAHALSGSYLYSLDLTPVRCATFCGSGGFALAGVQYETQCTCGNNLRSSAQLTAEANCDAPCSGNSLVKCGGTYHMNLFVNRVLLDAIAGQSSAALSEPTSSSTRAVAAVASTGSIRAASSAVAVVASRSSASVAPSSSSAAAIQSSPVIGASSVAVEAAAASSSSAAVAAAAAAAASAAAVTAAASNSSDGGSGGVSGGTIAGAVIGALAGLALLGALLFFLCRRRRQRQQRGFGSSGANEKAGGNGSAIALGAGGAWARQASGGSSEEGGTSAAYEKSGSGLDAELGAAPDGAGAGLGLDGAGAAVAGARWSSLARSNSSDDEHPHEMPYVLGPVIPASPLLGPGAGLLAPMPTPSDGWRPGPFATADDTPPPTREQNRRASMPLTNGDIYAPPLGPLPPAPDGPSGRSRSTEISRVVSPFADPPSVLIHARRPSTALSGNSFATAPLTGGTGGRRPSEGSTTSALGGRAASVSKQARKPVPALVDGDAHALEQQQYYNGAGAAGRKASDDSTASSSVAELLGGAREMLREDGVGLPSNEPSPSAGVGGGSGSKTPDLFKGWDGKQLRTLDVDEPLKQ